jgi:hypothetical protein
MSETPPPAAMDTTTAAATAVAVEAAPAPATLSAKLSKVIHKGLLSSPARFVGAYEDDTILLTHAWPSLSDPTQVARMATHNENSRHYYVLAFETPPQKIAPGVLLDDWTWVLRFATVALSIFFGKAFDTHGLIEGGGMFHVPEIKTSITPYPQFPPYNDDPRVDVAGDLNFARCGWLTRWLTSTSDAMRSVNTAGKYYLRALRSFGHDATSAYVDLVMAGEILTDRHAMSEEELYDAELRAVLDKLTPKEANLIKKRLFQVRRKFAAGLHSHLNAGFFRRTEAKGPLAERSRLVDTDIEKRLKAAYDVRSQYVHAGRNFGGHPHSMQDWRNEIQIGKPVTGSDALDDGLWWAPTFLGLERVIRFGLLRVVHKEIGPLHSDLDDDPSVAAAPAEAAAEPLPAPRDEGSGPATAAPENK